MEISDYIPKYPYSKDYKTFNKDIFEKKEFYELRQKSKEKDKQSSRWNHQELVSRYSGPHTYYDKQLIYHTPGTGKTCAMVYLIEDTLKFTTQTGLPKKKAYIIVPPKLIDQWRQQIAFKCTKGEYIPENYYSEDVDLKLTEGEKSRRVNDLIKQNYELTSIESFGNELERLDDKSIVNKYSNSIIVIDEAHNLKEIGLNGDNKKGKYYKLYYKFLHLIENSKVFLLTGTPMTDEASDIVGLLNLILPEKDKIDTKSFDKTFLEETESGKFNFVNKKDFYKKTISKISYITRGGDFPERIDVGTTKYTKFIKTVDTKMSDVQALGYLKAVEKDKEFKVGFHGNAAKAINFIYPNGEDYLWGDEAGDLLMIYGKKKAGAGSENKIIKGINNKYKKDIVENISKYSSKYAEIIKIAKEFPNDPIYIFNQRVAGTDGSMFLYFLLNAIGIKTEVITGDEKLKSKGQSKDIIKIFTSEKNRDASKIQVLIGTKAISEGVSLPNVKRVIIISPWWNNTVTEQAIGRGIRADSLNWLPKDERKVSVYQLIGVSDKVSIDKNIDIHKLKRTETKDLKIKAVERVLKEVAWDCALNYERNYKNSKKNSVECDYQDCNWTCYGLTPDTSNKKWRYTNIIEKEDTYNIFYSHTEKQKIKSILESIFRKNSMVKINCLKELSDKNYKLSLLTIQNMIDNNEKILNKWGIPCYIRSDENSNYIYLTENISNSKITDIWYLTAPFINKTSSLTEIINEKEFKDDLRILRPELTLEIIKKLSLETQSRLLESAYYTFNKNKSEKARKILELFKGKYGTFDIKEKKKIIKIPVHNIYKTITVTPYFDYNTGKKGRLRCFKEETWGDCGKDESSLSVQISKISKKESAVQEITAPIYGIMDDNRFKIIDRSKEKAGETRESGKSRGKVCSTWKKPELRQLLEKLNLEIEDFNKKTVVQICEIIKEHFIENNLLLTK